MSTEQNKETNPSPGANFYFHEGSQSPQKIHIDNRGGGKYFDSLQKVEGGLVVADTIENSSISQGGQTRKSDLDVLIDALELGARNEKIAASTEFQSLRSSIESRANPKLKTILTDYLDDPDTWAIPLRKKLEEAKLDQERSIMDAAKKVINSQLN